MTLVISQRSRDKMAASLFSCGLPPPCCGNGMACNLEHFDMIFVWWVFFCFCFCFVIHFPVIFPSKQLLGLIMCQTL